MKNHPTKLKTIRKSLRPKTPILRFTPTAWAKLLYLRDCGDTEVGGFGIAQTDDLLLVTDLELVDQRCSFATVAFDDGAVADFFDSQVDRGLNPNQFARIWVHTHPGNCPEPSTVDENTFARVFGHTDWAVMFILAQGGDTYARLQFHVGPGGAIQLPVEVDYTNPFAASDHGAWDLEYQAKVRPAADSWLPEEKSRLGELGSGNTASQKEPVTASISDAAAELRDPFYVEDYDYGW